MANFKTHSTVGAVIGGGIAVYDSYATTKELDFWLLLVGVAGGFLGGILPDVLEPPTNPHHRRFFHGMMPTATAAFISDFAGIENPRLKTFLKALVWGYIGHLIMDMGTPKSVPLVQ